MKAMLSWKNLGQAALFALVIAWVNVLGMVESVLDQRYEFIVGMLQWMVPVAFVARILSTKVEPFDRHPIITTSGVFASCVIAIFIFNQSVHAPVANHLLSNLMSFAASFGIAAIAGGICWLIERPWRRQTTRPTA